jgi:uncharacterized protein (TIGR02118 family)
MLEESLMIRVSVLYPDGPGARFDMGYYISKHMPMVKSKCGPACKSIAAEKGVAGGEPGSKATYVAIGYLTFDSVDAFQKSFGPHAGEILGDIPNYTNIKPIVQVSEVTL